jgi:hypothetical protein
MISPTENRILVSLHLQGHMGKCGSLNKQQRLALLQGLQAKGLLDKDCELTQEGVRVSGPNFKET